MQRLLPWFTTHARDLPWRHDHVSAWGILVSEVMLQQTPVQRVEPAWREWMQRWPQPGELAAASSAEVLAAWGRLGYPRRAMRLQQAAVQIDVEYAGQVPSEEAELRSLPGVGEYTAAAVRSFAFNLPSVVIDVNIRRVLHRVLWGSDHVGTTTSKKDREVAEELLLASGNNPAWNAAIMEFGALVCTARSPKCAACPIQDLCQWRLAGYPDSPVRRRPQAWLGTDRQARGTVIDHLRHAPNHQSTTAAVAKLWTDPEQMRRAVATLESDGLIHAPIEGYLALGPAPMEDPHRG